MREEGSGKFPHLSLNQIRIRRKLIFRLFTGLVILFCSSDSSTAIEKFTESKFDDSTGSETVNYSNLSLNYKAGYLREIEEDYNTNSFYQSLRFSKRFSDKFQLTFIPAIEYATRKQENLPDTSRWYDNTALKGEYNFNDYNALALFISGSISDTTWTAYGGSLKSIVEFDNFVLTNNITLSYEYFYYWTQVGQNFINEELKIQYSRFSLVTGLFYGVVDYNYIDGYTDKAENPNSSVNFDLQYKILYAPAISAGIQYYTRDFKYYSPLYYSPQGRKITGINGSFYNTFGEIYLYLDLGARLDNSDNFIWNIDSEVGYDIGDFSVSAGIGRFNDPFYTNYNTFINLTKIF